MLLADIAETFDNLRKINMKLNPKKCSFGMEEGKFLGYMVTSEEIRANLRKTKALADLQSPRMLKEMQSLSGKLAVLNRFLAKGGRSVPINEEAHYGSPIVNSTSGKRNPLRILGSIARGCKCGSLNRQGGKAMPRPKIEEVLRGPSDKGAGSGGFSLGSTIKGKGRFILPDAGGLSGIEYIYALRLTFLSTNNVAEYEALLAGLRIARQINISNIEVKVDSKLVASQININYEASKDIMIKYLAKAKEYVSGFKSFLIENIPRNMNQKADVLSKLASVAFNHVTKEVLVEVLNERSTESREVHTIVEEEGDN
ncbi:reverse transcriptase domain-containing protein [Tanacetum coccineum]